LSFPEVFFEVRRAARIVVKYQNISGKVQKLEAADDLLCRAIQHEVDHLDGQLFVNKAVSKLAANIELSKYGFIDDDDIDLSVDDKKNTSTIVKGVTMVG
jgi:peptide deformylase